MILGVLDKQVYNYTLTDAKSFNKIAFKYKQNDFSLYVNGIEVATDTSGNVLPANTLNNFEFEYGDNVALFLLRQNKSTCSLERGFKQ